MNNELMNLKEVAKYLNMSTHTVYRMTMPTAKRPIPHFKIGGALRFSLNKVNEWLSEMEVLA
ncbi:MAG: helix-turn-helix domain-containing protein [Saprospiraceae bacterium]|nr:helix-turn-helix domain-containing protein [Saprospiraceae bacterium]